jgi:undecaprenyl-diphosphatase
MTAAHSREAGQRWRPPIPRQVWLVIAAVGALVAFCLVLALRVLAVGAFDFPAILALNTFARRSQIVDHALQALAAFDLFQGIPLVALAYGAFAASRTGVARVRLVIGMVGAAAAAELSRLLQKLLPNLPRPIVDPALAFRHPYGGSPEAWRDWTSFPSDHATLLWGMAFATLLVDRRIGAVSAAVAASSSLARLYCGLHHPTDILAGMLLGVAVVCVFLAGAAPWEERLLVSAVRRPALFATVAFFLAAQAASLFHDVRTIADLTARHARDMGAGSGTPSER